MDTPEVAEYRKQIAELNAKVEALYARLVSLGDSYKDLVCRVVSTLQFVPRRGRKHCQEIETLPLLTRGMGPNCSDACDDFEALSFRLDELIAYLEAAEANRPGVLSSAPLMDPKTDGLLRSLKRESGLTWDTIANESGISVRRLYDISKGANISSDTRAKLSACFSRLLQRPLQF
ncbi:MAG: hypothetical protein LAP61_00550 [Acidobacteriia bacterium]|nr:hypothetical protein [Terriglobia bacterium]